MCHLLLKQEQLRRATFPIQLTFGILLISVFLRTRGIVPTRIERELVNDEGLTIFEQRHYMDTIVEFNLFSVVAISFLMNRH